LGPHEPHKKTAFPTQCPDLEGDKDAEHLDTQREPPLREKKTIIRAKGLRGRNDTKNPFTSWPRKVAVTRTLQENVTGFFGGKSLKGKNPPLR